MKSNKATRIHSSKGCIWMGFTIDIINHLKLKFYWLNDSLVVYICASHHSWIIISLNKVSLKLKYN